MKVTAIGTGCVGLVTSACLSEMGSHVVCLDVDPAKIKILNNCGITIHDGWPRRCAWASAAIRASERISSMRAQATAAPASRRVTEWKEFRTPDFEAIRDSLHDKIVFDGCNLYEPELI